jgi:hypothetical protein
MKRIRTQVLLLAACAATSLAMLVPATAAPAKIAKVPPVCIKVPLTKNAQLQVGYCPNG